MSTKELATSYWNGSRWLVTLLKERFLVEKLFSDYGSADSYCIENEKYAPCITSLSSLLKRLNGIASNSPDQEQSQQISDELDMYPLLSASSEDCLSSMLATGEYTPCYWQHRLHPLTAIDEYQVYAVGHESDIYNSKIKAVSIHTSFAKSMAAFKSLCLSGSTSKLIVLSGMLHTYRFTGKKVLYTAHNGITDVVHDITEPFVLSLPIFARYQIATKRLLFYDGSLRRIRPRKLAENYNFNYFNFDIFR